MAKDLAPQSRPGLSSFNWEDPFLLEDQLTEDERMLRDAAKAFAEAELAPRVTQAFREEIVAPEIFVRLLLELVELFRFAIALRQDSVDIILRRSPLRHVHDVVVVELLVVVAITTRHSRVLRVVSFRVHGVVILLQTRTCACARPSMIHYTSKAHSCNNYFYAKFSSSLIKRPMAGGLIRPS